VDSNSVEVQAELSGFKFRITDPSGNVVSQLETNAAGHAQSDPLPTGVTYRIEEVELPTTVASDPPHDVALDAAHTVVQHTNHVTPGNVYG
jgi:hypothetical protein